MCFASRCFLLLCLAASLPTGSGWGWGWNWNWDFEWSLQEPANCPHENQDTHVCSTLQSTNATCITVKCCSDFEDHEDFDSYDEDTDDGLEENVYYFGKISENMCSLCYTSRPCSVYRCYRRCCEGFEPDSCGRCRTIGNIECRNGGTVQRDAMGQYSCRCPPDFEGKSCEIPRCYCENGGECDVKDGRPYCRCSESFEGDRCERARCTLKCFNGGICLKNGSYEFCRCRDYFAGRQCERPFVQPPNCPAAEYHVVCRVECTGNDNCPAGSVCCREGCSTLCRQPRPDYCHYQGHTYRIGQSFQGTTCENCTCTSTGQVSCFTVTCSRPVCANNQQPVPTPGQCCHSCPAEPVPQGPVIKCPSGVISVNTAPDSDIAWFGRQNPFVRAYDAQTYQALQVYFRPLSVSHGRSLTDKPVTDVTAYATDSRGNMATCQVQVRVIDPFPPNFYNCPEDIYVFEDEIVDWQEPQYKDNVGIAWKTCSSDRNGKLWDAGDYRISYMVKDFDYNLATCNFRVSVTRRDTPQADVPQGLMDRSMDRNHHRLIVILAPVIGGLVIVGLVVLMLCCCRRHRRRPRDSRSSNGSGGHPPAYDNNIYSLPVDLKVKLPPYSPLVDPPAYTVCGSIKDETYITLPPPSYTNPGYETLPADLKSQIGSSVKANKAGE